MLSFHSLSIVLFPADHDLKDHTRIKGMYQKLNKSKVYCMYIIKTSNYSISTSRIESIRPELPFLYSNMISHRAGKLNTSYLEMLKDCRSRGFVDIINVMLQFSMSKDETSQHVRLIPNVKLTHAAHVWFVHLIVTSILTDKPTILKENIHL